MTMNADEIIPTIKSRVLVDGFEIVPDLEKSHGSTLVDKRTGKEMLDMGYNQFGSLTIGYNHPATQDPDYVKRLLNASNIRWALSDLYPEYYAEFVAEFSSVLPEGFKHLFFIDGGALAVENALKTAFDWKTRKNYAEKDAIPGDMIMHLKNAFHGRTGYTLSLTNTADPNKYKFFSKFDWPRVHNPAATFQRDGSVTYDNEELAKAEIEEAIKKYNYRIAAMIVEPVQGEGGDNYFSPSFFRFIRQKADEHGFLLIFDEVQTGWSTGEWWASDHLTGGVRPDIFSFGKKTQQCGIAANTRIDEIKDNVFNVSSRLNSTWGGTLSDMVRSTQFIRTIKKEGLIENSRRIGDKIKKILLNETDAEFVSNIRGSGGWIAFTLPTQEIRDKVWKEAYSKGAMTLKSGFTSIRMRPNLAFSEEDVDKGMAVLLPEIEAARKEWKN